MSNGLNLNSIMNVAALAGAAFTGGSSLMLMAASNAFQQVAQSALQGALQQLGVSPQLLETAMGAFDTAFAAASGNVAELSQEVAQLTQDITDMSNQMGELTQATDDLTASMTNYLTDQAAEEGGEASGEGEGASNWLVAIAKALGEKMGEIAGKMVELTDQLQTLGGESAEDAQEFNKVVMELQGQSQMYGMISQAANTVVKAIGEGMSAVARKT